MFTDQRVRYGRHAAALALASVLFVVAGMFTAGNQAAHAIGVAVPLGAAGSFSALGGQSVTNTGPSVLSGDLGVSPGSSITGFGGPPTEGSYGGALHQTDAVASNAQNDLTTAYNNAAGQAKDVDLTSPGDLGGLTLVGGVYKASSSVGLTGTLSLDAQGNPDTVWIFQIGSTLTTASNSSISFVNGVGSPCNVFWQVGSSAELGTNSDFVGTLMAFTSITATTGVDVIGRLLARNASVTLDTNDITNPTCAPPATDDDGTVVDAEEDAAGDDAAGDDAAGDDAAGDDAAGDDAAGDDAAGDDAAGDDAAGDDAAGDDAAGDDAAGDDAAGDDTDTGSSDGAGDDENGNDDDENGNDDDENGNDDDENGNDDDENGNDDDESGNDDDENGNDDDENGNDDSDNHGSKDSDTVPKGNPATGMGGTAGGAGSLSMALLTLGSVAGASSLMLVAAPAIRRHTRQRQ
jgi:hypothetical protein